MAALPARQHCQHDSIAGNAALPERQHCQHGSNASTEELPEWQHGSYAIIANILFFMQLHNLEMISYMQPCFSLLYKQFFFSLKKKFKMADSKKLRFSKPPILAKISQIGPWVSRID